MMMPVFHLDGAGMALIDLHPGAEFKSVVEGGAVEDRDVSGRYREAAKAGYKRLYVLVRKCAELIAKRAETAHVGRSCSPNVGRGPSVQLVLRHQNHV